MDSMGKYIPTISVIWLVLYSTWTVTVGTQRESSSAATSVTTVELEPPSLIPETDS